VQWGRSRKKAFFRFCLIIFKIGNQLQRGSVRSADLLSLFYYKNLSRSSRKEDDEMNSNAIKAFFNAIPNLLAVIPSTLILFVCIMAMGIVLGMLLAWERLRKRPIPNALVSIYISFMRGTPLLIQVLIVYFGLRAIFIKGFGIQGANHWPPAFFAFIAYGLNLSAFLCETFRSAYLSVDHGQIEAGLSINMTKGQIFRRVILPQGARIALPNMGNLLIDDYKALSLAFSIGLVELMGRGNGLSNMVQGVGAIGIYLAVALLYWVVCYALSKLLDRIEWSLSKDLRAVNRA